MNLYETIHLDDYTRSGEGGQGVAYTSKTGKRLAKLFNPGFDTTLAIHEFQMAQAAYEAGVPTPRPYRLITDGERDLWIDIGQFAYGAPEWDLSLCWRISRIEDPRRTTRSS